MGAEATPPVVNPAAPAAGAAAPPATGTGAPPPAGATPPAPLAPADNSAELVELRKQAKHWETTAKKANEQVTELSQRWDGLTKAILGDKHEAQDPKAVQAEIDRVRAQSQRIAARSHAMALAGETLDPELVAVAVDLDGVEVDFATGRVKNPEVLRERVGAFIGARPWLRRAPPAAPAAPAGNVVPPPNPALGAPPPVVPGTGSTPPPVAPHELTLEEAVNMPRGKLRSVGR